MKNNTVLASGFLWLGLVLSAGVFAQSEDEQGKQLFTQKAVPACAFCHSLKHADSMAESGPDLDSLQPDAKTIENAIRHGKGDMPAIKGLSEEEIKVLVRYLQRVAGKS